MSAILFLAIIALVGVIAVSCRPILTTDTKHFVRVEELCGRVSQAATARMRSIVNGLPHPLILVSPQGIVSLINSAAEQRFGIPATRLVGIPLRDLVSPASRMTIPEYLSAAFAAEGASSPRRQIVWLTADGEEFSAEVTVQPVVMGRGVYLFLSLVDLSAQLEWAAQLEQLAFCDPLTQLPNRASILDSIQSAIDRWSGENHFAVLFLDFDRFKLINDSLGHAAGDELLRQIAQRLRSALRANDKLVAARLGGDEFLVLVGGLAEPRDAVWVAERLLQTFAAGYDIAGKTVYSTASIGVATSERTYQSAHEVIRDADLAMYEAKANGKGCFAIFDADLLARAKARIRDREIAGANSRT